MKKILSAALFIFALSALIMRVGFPNFELGKYDSLKEAIKKGIPYKIEQIIHTEKYDGVTIIMYTTRPNKEELPFANYEALALAFFKGNNHDGWETIGPHEWTHYDNDNLTVYFEPLRDYDNTGKLLHEFYVVFGEINNPEIVTVEAKTKEEKTFKKAEIISYDGKCYYFKIGKDTIVRGLSNSGEVIDLQGG